ncbi:MAG: hypothetical protein ACD_7C00075G0001 [uncultured bacterium]|nr:MAG: hypothetical protein ACD_7C00075G0001 [uncultured bacterium]HBR79878.1 hypothetical protein [Candidatus Moranbacteria bacterium]
MKNKKVILITALFLVGFGLVYLFVVSKMVSVPKVGKQIAKKEDAVKLDLSKLECNFASDQEAYNDASKNNNLDACSCIKDENTKEMCIVSTTDTILYSRALTYLDEELCTDIKVSVHKDACYAVIKDSVKQLEAKNPQHLADIYALSHNEKAITSLEQITQKNSATVDNYISLALAYAEKGLKEQGQGRDQTQYILKAFGSINKAKELDKNKSEIYRVEAYVNEIKPDYKKAQSLYSQAIEMDSNNILAYAGRGHVKRMLAVLDGAVEDFKKAADLDIKREHIYIYTNLCNLEYSKGDVREATKNCKIVTDKKDVDPVFQSEAYQIMADIFMKNGDSNQSRASLLKAKTLTPIDPNIFITFSKLNIFEGNYQEAEVNARKAMELSPAKASAQLALSYALYMENKFDDSIATALAGISLVDKDVSLLIPSKLIMLKSLNSSIANCYREMGNSEKQSEYEKKAQEFSNNK